MTSPDRILITEPGGDAPYVADHNGYDCSWAVQTLGTFSAEIPTETLISQYGTTDLRGYWVRWEHPSLGAHTGVIEDLEPTLGTGTTELAGREMGAVLAKRRTAKEYDVVGASPGGLSKRAISDASKDRFTWISRFEIDEGGEPITTKTRAESLFDLANDLAQRSESEWRVDDGRESGRPQNSDILVFRWGRPLGLDRTTTVLSWGREIVDGRVPGSIRPVVNDLLVMPADERYALSQAFTVEDRRDIERRGNLQDTLIIEGRVTKSVMIPIAKAELRRLVALGQAMTLEVADIEDVWNSFRQGDRITIDLPQLNLTADYRVLVRHYSTDTDTLTVTGDWVVAS